MWYPATSQCSLRSSIGNFMVTVFIVPRGSPFHVFAAGAAILPSTVLSHRPASVSKGEVAHLVMPVCSRPPSSVSNVRRTSKRCSEKPPVVPCCCLATVVALRRPAGAGRSPHLRRTNCRTVRFPRSLGGILFRGVRALALWHLCGLSERRA